ncbi:hypothetical protein [Photobacterium damselae]|uniref:hypothetical protein n=1 Tax=Photobacterium damselae TaxID=38293 RepID=UPI000D665AA7|nr:hypothetical protein [Photobacterium damselae]AWK84659.1 hypothetical protein BST98_21775 [Photobacterium damselae]MCG3826471.1 hypothetical protein [Photobacterium damselae]NVO59004.1 hypothetical protein [Photobacterium damselae subsp. damselae]TLS83978.1 hypothetical protein FD720_18430 [Photobacterium damselae subsp. damselae]
MADTNTDKQAPSTHRKPRTRGKKAAAQKPIATDPQSTEARKPFVFEQTRKAMPYALNAKSTTVLDYLNRNGGRATGAFQRIAALSQLTQLHSETRTRLKEWFDCRLALSQGEITKYEAMVVSCKEDVVIEPLGIVVPESFTYTIEVTHPIFWRCIGIIEAVDRNVAEFENMWIAGLIDDDVMMESRRNGLTIITDLVTSIYQITNASRDRKGGLYSPVDFKEIMAALSPKEQEE